MSDIITIGRRLVPLKNIALVETYEPNPNEPLSSSRCFQARVVLTSRESLLTEETVEAFAETHGMRRLPDEPVALNPKVRFGVERFTAPEDFSSPKTFATRLCWREADGQGQSKLLVTAPEAVLAVLGTAAPAEGGAGGTRLPPATFTARRPVAIHRSDEGTVSAARRARPEGRTGLYPAALALRRTEPRLR